MNSRAESALAARVPRPAVGSAAVVIDNKILDIKIYVKAPGDAKMPEM
jgi:hypothetical protein